MEDHLTERVTRIQQGYIGLTPGDTLLRQLTERNIEIEETNILWPVDHRKRDGKGPFTKIWLNEHNLPDVEGVTGCIEASKQREHAHDAQLVRPISRRPTDRQDNGNEEPTTDKEESVHIW
jgi:hypothetical protein